MEKALTVPRKKIRMPKSKVSNNIKKVSDKICVAGSRGQWDVVMWIHLAGSEEAISCPVRLNQGTEFFETTKVRDAARQYRDTVQRTLALEPNRPVFARVKDQAIVSFCAKNFDHVWREPRNQIRFVGRKDRQVRLSSNLRRSL